MKIYIVGKNEQYIGTQLIDIKLTEQEAQDWCEEQQRAKGDIFTTFAYKEMELNLGTESTGIGLYDKAYAKALEWAHGDKSKLTVSLVHTFLYNMLFYDTEIIAFITKEGGNINAEGMKRGAENAKKNMEANNNAIKN
jgi:hypothetical protein